MHESQQGSPSSPNTFTIFYSGNNEIFSNAYKAAKIKGKKNNTREKLFGFPLFHWHSTTFTPTICFIFTLSFNHNLVVQFQGKKIESRGMERPSVPLPPPLYSQPPPPQPPPPPPPAEEINEVFFVISLSSPFFFFLFSVYILLKSRSDCFRGEKNDELNYFVFIRRRSTVSYKFFGLFWVPIYEQRWGKDIRVCLDQGFRYKLFFGWKRNRCERDVFGLCRENPYILFFIHKFLLAITKRRSPF